MSGSAGPGHLDAYQPLQHSPRSGAHQEAGLRFRRPDWSLPGTAAEKSLRSIPLPGQSGKQGVWRGPSYRARDALTGSGRGGRFTPDGLRSGGEWVPGQRGPGPAGRHGRGGELPAEPPMRLGPASQQASLGALPLTCAATLCGWTGSCLVGTVGLRRSPSFWLQAARP